MITNLKTGEQWETKEYWQKAQDLATNLRIEMENLFLKVVVGNITPEEVYDIALGCFGNLKIVDTLIDIGYRLMLENDRLKEGAKSSVD